MLEHVAVAPFHIQGVQTVGLSPDEALARRNLAFMLAKDKGNYERSLAVGL